MVARERTVAFSARTMSTAALWIDVSISSAGTNYIWSSIPDRQIKQIGIHTHTTRTKTHTHTHRHMARLKLSPAANVNKQLMLMFGFKLITVALDPTHSLNNSYTVMDCAVYETWLLQMNSSILWDKTWFAFLARAFSGDPSDVCTVNRKLETENS